MTTKAASIILRRGEALVQAAAGAGTTLGGIVQAARELNFALMPSLGFVVQPSGPIERDFYLSVRDEFLAAAKAGGFDAIALDLHGAMSVDGLDDAEGDLLSRLRAIVGPAVPIAVGLDMHAHVTQAMMQAADICISCKENPHTDFRATGQKLVRCLNAMLEGTLKPVRAMAKAPMIALDSGLTALPPLSEIKSKAEAFEREHSSVWDISLCSVYRFGDFLEEKGQAVLVLSNDDEHLAVCVAETLAVDFWTNRDRFRETLPSIDDAIDLVLSDPGRRPFVLGDLGDRVLAGAPGDSTAILARVLERGCDLATATPVTDPESVARAIAAGIGGDMDLEIGGKLTPGFAPLAVRGKVANISAGTFRISGPFLEGEVGRLGLSVVLCVQDRHRILLTTEPGLTHTPSAFLSQGIDVAGLDLIVAKSGQHYRANFAGVANALSVATPGLSAPTTNFFRWKNREFWPESNLCSPIIRARTFY